MREALFAICQGCKNKWEIGLDETCTCVELDDPTQMAMIDIICLEVEDREEEN